MNTAVRSVCAVALVSSLIVGCQTVQKPSWQLPAGVKTLQVDGYPMAYLERGTGTPVVLVHGSLNDYRTWFPQMEPLSSRFRVTAVSLRHYYPEPWNGEGQFSLQVHATDVARFIEGLGGGPVHLVGWSRGGYVAAEVAKTRPDLVRKLVLMDAALYALVPNGSAAGTDDIRVKRAKATEPYFKRGDMEGGLQFFFDDINGPGAWSRLPEAQRQLRRENAWTIVGQLGDNETLTCADLRQFKMPVLLMEGEQSPPLFKQLRAAAQQCIPSARSVTIPKGTHQMHQTNPASVNAELIKFLSD